MLLGAHVAFLYRVFYSRLNIDECCAYQVAICNGVCCQALCADKFDGEKGAYRGVSILFATGVSETLSFKSSMVCWRQQKLIPACVSILMRVVLRLLGCRREMRRMMNQRSLLMFVSKQGRASERESWQVGELVCVFWSWTR